MNIEQLRNLIKNNESSILEFKTSTAELTSAFETICAFLNKQGGTVLIGVKDDHSIVGQHVSSGTQKDLARCINKIEPHANISIDEVPVGNDKVVLVLRVDKKGEHAPYCFDGRPFERIRDSTHRMSQHCYEQLLVERAQLNHSWEEFPIDEISLADLNQEDILYCVRKSVENHRLPESALRENLLSILKRFKLTCELDNTLLRNAAVVLFVKQEKSPIRCQIKLARFKGLSKGEFIDNKIVQGNIFYLLEQALKFIDNHLPIASEMKEDGIHREDVPAIPTKVLREAIVNAMCHCDYSIRGGATSIAIFDDRIEIISTGGLPKGISIEDLSVEHTSVQRNPYIAKVLFSTGLVEAWGKGTQEMIENCRSGGYPEPLFNAKPHSFMVTLFMKESINRHHNESIKIPSIMDNKSLTPRQMQILNIINSEFASEFATTQQIKAKLQPIASLRTVQIELAALKKAGLVVSIGQGKAITWKIKR